MATAFDYWIGKHELIQAMKWTGKITQWKELIEFCGSGRVLPDIEDDSTFNIKLVSECCTLAPGDWIVKKYLIEGPMIHFKPDAFKIACWKADKTLKKKNEIRSALKLPLLTAKDNNENE